MNERNSVPNIRFNGFEDEWKLSKLGNDLISIHTGTNLLGSEKAGGIPLIKMGNLKNGFFDFSKLDYLPICENVKNEDKVRFGDFLFNTRNTLDLVGKGATWMYESTKFAYNNNIAKFNFQNSINTVFFNYLYNTYNVMNQVHARATGTTSVAAIYPKSLDSIIYNLPSKHEQQKIGNFFAKLDKLLDLQQQKIDKLELLKKALLQKLFPKHDAKIPELRFKVYKDNWESKKFKNILNYERPDKYIVKSDNYSNNGIPVLTANKSFILGYTQEPNFYEKSLPVIIFDDFTLDCKLVSFPFKIKSSAIKILSPNNFSDIWFDFYLLKVTYFIKEGHARHYISIVQSKITNVPGKAEQQKIGNLLSKVDQLIELENKKLENLQQFKKCLLQNMFVE